MHIPEERGLVPGTPSVQRRDCYRPWENQQLKDRLTTTPPSLHRLQQTIYSGYRCVGIGAVLAQHDNDGHERVVAFASRTLSKSEHRYCVTRRELLAVVVFTQHFRPYLLAVADRYMYMG